MSPHTAQLARSQAMFRAVNERVAAWPERQVASATDKLMRYCECADVTCFERVYLSIGEYEQIRADSTRFAVVPGHVFPEVEHVVAGPDGYDVVEKYEAVRAILERTDPRKGAYS